MQGTETTTTTTAQFPHYYESDSKSQDGSTRTLYGKIEENGFHTTITETIGYNKIYEIERTIFGSIELSGLARYFDEKYKSREEEYEEAKERCISFLNA